MLYQGYAGISRFDLQRHFSLVPLRFTLDSDSNPTVEKIKVLLLHILPIHYGSFPEY